MTLSIIDKVGPRKKPREPSLNALPLSRWLPAYHPPYPNPTPAYKYNNVMVSPALRPEACCRFREASEDDELIIDDESDETGGTVTVSLWAGRPLNVPTLWIT